MATYSLGIYSLSSHLLLVAALFLLSPLSCCINFKQNFKQDWQTNKQLWESKHLVNYKITLRVNCFCGAAGASPVSIVVRDGLTKSIIKLRTSESVEYPFFTDYENIPKLFSLIENHLNEKIDSFCVEYDSIFGYPKKISLDRERNTADDELDIEVISFEILQRFAIGR